MTAIKNERPLVSFDWALKRLLRNKANYEVVEGFLSELLNRQIKVQNIVESGSNKTDPEDKHNRVDVIVEDESGEIILIELQFMLEADYFHRMLYGVSKTITEYMDQGDQYMKVKKVYSINIVYFDLGQGNDYVYLGKVDFRGLHKNDDVLLLSEKQRKLFGKTNPSDFFPEYYILKINQFDDVAKDTLDEWIYFLKHDRIKDGFSAKGLEKARDLLAYDKLSPSEKKEYDYEWMQKSHRLSEIASAKDEARIESEEIIEELKKALKENAKALKEKDEENAALKRLLKENNII
jgi:hypothetical protein